MAFTTLANHIDINWMHMAYAQTRQGRSCGRGQDNRDDYEE